MTNWTDFAGNPDDGIYVTNYMLQQIIDNTSNIYERIMVLQSLKGSGVPVGGILLWKGSYATIPEGFQLADGTNGTPDLRGMFLMGMASSDTDDNLLETGGASTHTHTVGTFSQATKHKHTVYINDSTGGVSVKDGVSSAAFAAHDHAWSAETATADQHTHTGAYAETNHLPPYTKYYYIVRIPA